SSCPYNLPARECYRDGASVGFSGATAEVMLALSFEVEGRVTTQKCEMKFRWVLCLLSVYWRRIVNRRLPGNDNRSTRSDRTDRSRRRRRTAKFRWLAFLLFNLFLRSLTQDNQGNEASPTSSRRGRRPLSCTCCR